MKHLKKFEDIPDEIDDATLYQKLKGDDINPDYEVNVGDKLYCIYNNGVEQELEIGKEYTVDKVWPDEYYPKNTIFRLAELGSRWMKFRFSKDPNHINIVKHYTKNYNL